MKYPKIYNLYKRSQTDPSRLIYGEYTQEEFENVILWSVTEKIDGTNIRVYWYPKTKSLDFRGRTDNAQLPPLLLSHLKKTLTPEKLESVFPDGDQVILYGEGYGKKIQSVGSKYIPDGNGFILFDTVADGWWLRFDSVQDIAGKLGILSVPLLGHFTKESIVNIVKDGFHSQISHEWQLAEGIIARSHPLMLFRNGLPLMFKLKHRDFQNEKN